MKRLLLIGILGFAAWAGYQWLNDVMLTERLGSAIAAAIDDPRSRPIELIRGSIHQAFESEGITLDPSDIEINIASSNAQTLSGKMVSKIGFNTKTQRLTAHVTYKRSMWGTNRVREIERIKVFVASVTPVASNTNRVLDRARNLRDKFRNQP